MCSLTKMVMGNVAQLPPPTLLGPKKWTMAVVLMLPSQVRISSEATHGPIPSARVGAGRLCSMQIFAKSDRSSIQLLRKPRDISGQTGENSAR